MASVADIKAPFSPSKDDPARVARAEMVRAMFAAMTAEQRADAIADIRDLLPDTIFEKPKAPQRGGDVLNNVFLLFKREPEVTRAAQEVKEKLANEGKDADVQAVRNALNYLNSRHVLQRIGYGRYRLADGSLVEGPL